ncbi:MAG: hypothetical protein KYX67_08605 [Brevundimonas sp.]|uniref:Uncharacterized protein n=1 Tax=Brevundimonas mediterranea TaxID=74329 RepID=A0A7W6A350_9CAUL|nr:MULTISPECIES: hypothetical protein [Brevundimonas]MBB3872354.1 hypothetical protein [Brevundimonas mediterranea]MDK2747365.1 hypothetical protein [Brevundimonas sp.]
MDRDGLIWFGLAITAALVAMPGVLAGGLPLLPLFLVCLGLACTLHSGSRRLVVSATLRLLSRGALRTAVIVLGAVMLIQLLPLEMALFMAGDVLAYVEVLAAVGLIAANARVRVIRGLIGAKADQWRAAVRRRIANRMPRVARPAARRRPPAPDDDPAAGWAFA